MEKKSPQVVHVGEKVVVAATGKVLEDKSKVLPYDFIKFGKLINLRCFLSNHRAVPPRVEVKAVKKKSNYGVVKLKRTG